jgi:hypothetical protein
VVGTAHSAHAQLIQQYFPSDIPGYAPDFSSSVVVRLLNQNQSQGIETGDFTIRPQISESAGYKGDVLGTPNSSSSEIESSAGVKVNSNWTRDAVGGSFSVDNQEYPELPSASFTNWTAGIGGALTLGNDAATIGYSHLALHLSATDLGVSGVVTPVPYSVDDVRLSYLKLLSRFSITPSFEYENFEFGQASGAVSVSDNALSHQTESAGLSTLYEFSPGNNATAILRLSQSQFKTAPVNNYVDAAGFVGLDFRGDSVIQYRALAGYESRKFSTGESLTVSTPTFELDAVWTPTKLDTITATGFRELDDPTTPFALNQTVTTGMLQLDHELRANVFLRANAGVGESVSQSSVPGQGSDKQMQLSFGVSAFWNINRHMRGTISYGYSDGMASGPHNNAANGSGFANFTSNSISVGISLFE